MQATVSRALSSHWGPGLAIAGVCLGAYANTLDAPFVFDDLSSIVHNRHIRVEGLDPRAWWAAAFESPLRRPVASLTFALNYAVGGLEVRSYHVVNLAIHGLNGLLVYALAVSLLGRLRPGEPDRTRRLALLAALVFVSHPIQTQAVTYVVQRMTSLAALLYLGALLAWLRGRACSDPRRRRAWWGGAALSGVLAFGAKEIAVTLPLAMLLVEWQFYQDGSSRWLRARAAPLAGLGALLAAAGVAYLVAFGLPGYAERDFTLGERLLTELRVVVFYLSLIALPLPSRLNLTHPFPISSSLLDPPSTALAGLLLAVLLGLAVAMRRRERVLSFAILWLFLHLLVESSVLPLELVFEHRLYLPMVGVALLVADGFGRLGRRLPVAGLAVGVTLVTALAAATHVRNEVWTDAVVLWEDVVAKSPDDARARYALALAYDVAGARVEAERQYREALRLDPFHAAAVNAVGMRHEERGELDQALARYAEASRLDPAMPIFPTNQALLLARQERLEEAEEILAGVVASHPDYAKAHYALGYVLELRGRRAGAARAYHDALRAHPDYPDAHLRLAVLFAEAGELDRALEHAAAAVRLAPQRPEAASLLERLRRAGAGEGR